MTIFRRKITDELQEWKDGRRGYALLIRGARGVGKTAAVKEFVESNYESYILIDFSEPREEVNELFWNMFHIDAFFEKLESIYNVKLVPGHSAIIFDEVQCFLRARECVDHLVEDGRYDFIETGSHLSSCPGLADIRIPGKEHRVTMHPMDFEEFLWALHGNDETVTTEIRNAFLNLRPLGPDLHASIMEDLKKYMLVGGMPQAVAAFIGGAEDGFALAERAKLGILAQFMEDIAKFGDTDEDQAKIESVFKWTPLQLTKRDKTFGASRLAPGACVEDYEESISWLKDAGIIRPCLPSDNPDWMLWQNFGDSSVKCYMADTGLLTTLNYAVSRITMAEDMYLHNDVLEGRLGTDECMLLENVASQMMGQSRCNLLFYKPCDSAGADFMIYKVLKICPVEVRSGTARGFESYGRIRNKYPQHIGKGYMLHTGDLAVRYTVVFLPIYMAMFL
ncbi:MAG: AAA family ATPase [Clostridia bacterium]|nr:AAA family ATPase [Clostridia bacterium]